jgi:predicted alpha/beta hydrolase family esterase
VRNEAEIVLCAECDSFLVDGEEQDMKNVWPAFIWDALRNGVIAGHHGIGVWSYIPTKW